MNVGISVPLPAYAVDPAFMAKTAEELGFESFWCAEHPFIPVHSTSRFAGSPDGVIPESYSHFVDPFVALARASAVTKTMKLATGIVLVPERHPLLLAKEISTLDLFSGGRFMFGIGAGWLREETQIMGGDFDHRWTQTRESILAIKELWTKPAAEFHGTYYDFPPLKSFPKPAHVSPRAAAALNTPGTRRALELELDRHRARRRHRPRQLFVDPLAEAAHDAGRRADDGAVRRHVTVDDEGVRAHLRVVPHPDRTEQDRVGPDEHVVADDRMPLAVVLAGAAQAHVVEQDAVVADHRALPDDDARAVVDEEAAAEARARMDLDAGPEAVGDGNESRQEAQAQARVDPVRHPMDQDRVQRRVAEHDLQPAVGGRIVAFHRLDVLLNRLQHRCPPETRTPAAGGRGRSKACSPESGRYPLDSDRQRSSGWRQMQSRHRTRRITSPLCRKRGRFARRRPAPLRGA